MTASARLDPSAPVDEESEPARQLRAAVATAAAAAAQHTQHLRSARLGRHAGILNRTMPKDEGCLRDEEEEEMEQSSETTTASAPTPTDDLSDHEGTATSSSKTLPLTRLQSKLEAEENGDDSPAAGLALPPYIPSCGGDGLLVPNSVLYYWPSAGYGPPGVHWRPATAPAPSRQAVSQPRCAVLPAAKALADAWIPLSPSASSAPEPPEQSPVEPAPVGPAAVGPAAVQAPPAPAPCRSEQLPSLGSKLHTNGRCKPCAFFHTKGCESGLNCQFCHLCDDGEKKRRRREKLLKGGKPPRSRAKNFARAQ